MSAIFRRAYSTKTLVPPNVAAATKLSGSAKDGQISQLVSFYKVKKQIKFNWGIIEIWDIDMDV